MASFPSTHVFHDGEKRCSEGGSPRFVSFLSYYKRKGARCIDSRPTSWHIRKEALPAQRANAAFAPICFWEGTCPSGRAHWDLPWEESRKAFVYWDTSGGRAIQLRVNLS